MADMAADATPSWAKKWENYRTPHVGNSGTARKTKDSGKEATVAVPELQRIQELRRVILTGSMCSHKCGSRIKIIVRTATVA